MRFHLFNDLMWTGYNIIPIIIVPTLWYLFLYLSDQHIHHHSMMSSALDSMDCSNKSEGLHADTSSGCQVTLLKIPCSPHL